MRAAGLALAASLVVACSGGGGGDPEAFCAEVDRAPALDLALNTTSGRDPDAIAAELEEVRTAYHRVRDTAPDEIRSDVEEVVTVVDAVMDAVARNPDDLETAADELRTVIQRHPELTAARQAMVTYVADTCGRQLDAPDAPVEGDAVSSTTGVEETTTTGG